MRSAVTNYAAFYSNDPSYDMDHLVSLSGGGAAQASLFSQLLSWNLTDGNTGYQDTNAAKVMAITLPRQMRIAMLGLLTMVELNIVANNSSISYIGSTPDQLYILQESILNEIPNPIVSNMLSDVGSNYTELMNYLSLAAPPTTSTPYSAVNSLFQQANYSNDTYMGMAVNSDNVTAAGLLWEYFNYPNQLLPTVQNIVSTYISNTR
jgi:hypothetical protein